MHFVGIHISSLIGCSGRSISPLFAAPPALPAAPICVCAFSGVGPDAVILAVRTVCPLGRACVCLFVTTFLFGTLAHRVLCTLLGRCTTLLVCQGWVVFPCCGLAMCAPRAVLAVGMLCNPPSAACRVRSVLRFPRLTPEL